MQSSTQHNGRKTRVPYGISFVEFVGCLAALGGGVVLGSVYLGVDVQTLAAGLLEQADIEVPAILGTAPETNDSEATGESNEAENPAAIPTEGVLPTANEDQTDLDRDEATSTQPEDETVADGSSSDIDGASVDAEPKELTDAEKLAATHDCWLSLKESVQQEQSSRSNWMNESQGWQLFDYLLHRKKGHQKALEAIEEFNLHGIDSRLKAHVQQVLSWHRAGSELFDRAAQLLTNAPAGKLTGPFAQSWQSSATQHRMEEKLLLNKHAAVASYLEHTRKMASPTTGN